MNAAETLRAAYGAIRGHRMRSALTVLGILIGIAAVMLVVALGDAARIMVLRQISAMGTNLIMVTAGGDYADGGSGGPGEFQSFQYKALSTADAEALADPVNAPDVAGVAPTNETYLTGKVGDSAADFSVVGTTADWLSIRNRSIALGRFLSDSDVDGSARVAVISAQAASNLFSNQDPVGAQLELNGQDFTVIGVLNPVDDPFGEEQENVAVIPRSVLVGQLEPTDPTNVNMIYVQAGSEEALSAAYQQIDQTLLTRHGNTPQTKDFSILTQQSLIDTAAKTTAILTATLGGIAAISLLVGGIGVMNIMLVSVTERTREIGLRKALGATPGAIRSQFLAEASMLGLLGGVLGMALGSGVAWIIAKASGYPVAPSLSATAVALGFSLLIGIIAGVYPAARAAKLAPIDALRSE